MNAKEMFKERGFTKSNECTNPSYFKKDDPYAWINFSDTGVAISSQHELGYEHLDYELIKAIYTQMKELGVDLMNDIKIPSIEFVRLKKGMTDSELNDYIAENDDYSFLVYLRYKYDFEEEWTYSTECAAWNACEDCVSWLNDWYEGQQNVEYLAISKLGEEYDC